MNKYLPVIGNNIIEDGGKIIILKMNLLLWKWFYELIEECLECL